MKYATINSCIFHIEFLSLQKKSCVKSRYSMFKHKIYKHGIMRNIALFIGKVKL